MLWPVRKTYLWLYLPGGFGSSLVSFPSVLVSRKHWNLALCVVERHKPSLILESLADGFVSALVRDVAALQDSWDLWWSVLKEKLVAVSHWIHHFSYCGNEGQEEEGSDGQETPTLQGCHHHHTLWIVPSEERTRIINTTVYFSTNCCLSSV